MARLTGRSAALEDSSLLAELERMIGLTDAIQLHGLLKDRKAGGKITESQAVEPLLMQLRDDILSTRKTLLDTLATACNGEDSVDVFVRWPNLDVVAGLDGLTSAQRLERFYSRFQQILQVRVQELRQRSRNKIIPLLPRLAELDSWLERSLAPYLEKSLAAIPRQLGLHCADILADNRHTLDRDSNNGSASEQTSGQRELRLLTCSWLIAETDVRLEPVRGLLEAVEDIQRTD